MNLNISQCVVKKKLQIYNDILLCAKNRKFIRLGKLDKFARQTRYFLLFTISFSSVRFIFSLRHDCASSLFRFYAPLPLFREINRMPGVATESVNFSKRMATLLADKWMKTNDLTWSLLASLENTVPVGETRFIRWKTRYATRPMFSPRRIQQCGRLSLLLRWILFSDSARTRRKDYTLRTHSSVRPHRSWRFDFTGHEFRKARRHAVNL